MQTLTIEALLETERFPNIAGLYSWSSNYEYEKRPFAVFLNLIGWTNEHLGEYLEVEWALDYTAMDYMAGALAEVTKTGQDAYDYVSDLMIVED